ncbi:MAG TPA: SpvB/TcaC N-terminal domain-containing protein [Thermoanaerobaculia bacterium]
MSLPKGGGAIHGIGEKFQTSSATGTATVSVPVSLSPGRNGFGPSLALAYDSGSGNGLYGLGWSVALPSIRRKTDKGLPRYHDAAESDTYLLAGSEDLVRTGGGSATVTRYRPRIEGAFSRIERVAGPAGVFWRTISGDNVTTTFGTTANSRIADPDDPTRIFEWLIDGSYDDRGNAVAYEYAPENLDNVPRALHEEHRRGLVAFTNRHPKRIRYGNRAPLAPGDPLPADDQWLFCAVFDYGDHDAASPRIATDQPWPVRNDPFSTYRAGFEVRTYRLCRRILMFHRFPELGVEPLLVRSTDLAFSPSHAHAVLREVRHSGYLREAGEYTRASLPPVELEYTQPAWDTTVHVIDADSLEGAPAGVDGTRYRFVDLDGEGLSGVLTEQAGAWWYKRNEGGGAFAPPHRVETLPSLANLSAGRQQLVDLDGDGRVALVDYSGYTPGFYERTGDGDWHPFDTFRSLPNIAWDDANLRFVDLDGDGRADVLITEHDVIAWYPSLAEDGFGEKREVPKAIEEARGPRVVFADGTQSIHVADMSGDGLQDLVRIRNGEVCYWPSLGYGRFGAKVTMSGAPRFDRPDQFDVRRIRFSDVDGSGTTDLIYLAEGAAHVYLNESGNRFAAARVIPMPHVDNVVTISVADVLGSGTSAIVWSSPLPARGAPWRYIDLLGGAKPHLLNVIRNNLGAQTRLEYAPSTRFYLADRRAGRPWATKLPFVVQVVERTIADDFVAGHHLVTRYAYHHGYFDGVEREFRGFGHVQEWSHETFPGAANPLDQPAERTETWFHTGAWIEGSSLQEVFRREWWNGDPAAWPLADPPAQPAAMTVEEQREAARALRGRPLRREVFAEDGTPEASRPYAVTQTTHAVTMLQPRGSERHAVFHVRAAETMNLHYERNAADPRITHDVVIDADAYGNATAEASIAYARRVPQAPALAEQGTTTILYTTRTLSNHEDATWRRIGVPIETRRFELTPPAAGAPFDANELRAAFAVPAARRLLGAQRIVYWRDDLAGALPLGDPGRRALPRQSFDATFTADMVATIYGARVTDAILQNEGAYDRWPGEADGLWWDRSGVQEVAAARFYAAVALVDPWGNRTSVDYDAHSLLPVATRDALPAPLTNTITVTNDYRVLAPSSSVDPNGNITAVRFDALGMVVATAVLGKGGEGDTLADPTTRIFYDLDAWRLRGEPCFVRTEARERHGAANRRWQIVYSYSDGSGQEILKKTQAEGGRWVGTGRVVLNNKGNPVQRFEPYFAADERFEVLPVGVSSSLEYDPMDRLIRTDHPNGTFTRVVFSAWDQATWDENDTVLESTWHLERLVLPAGHPERRADTLTAAHANTPGRAYFDARSRAVVTVEQSDPATEHVVRTTYDIEGRQLAIRDARGVEVLRQHYDLTGRKMRTESADAGDSRVLLDAEGKTLYTWDGSGAAERRSRVVYDEIDRPTQRWVRGTPASAEFLAERIVYGERHPDASARNLRLEIFRTYDAAGVGTNERFDFKGNVTESTRRFAVEFRRRAEWQVLAPHQTIAALEGAAAPLLLAETFTTLTQYDALNRVTQVTRADASVVTPRYNEANLLDAIDVRIRGAAPPPTPFIRNIDYDAKGQRTRVVYGNDGGNDVVTEYSYDPLTYRLTRALTNRPASGALPAAKLQDLNYTYDPTGHIVAIRDDAQQNVFFDNAVAAPHALYEYDALYRLTYAEGRELAANAAGVQPDHQQIPRRPLPHANDAAAVRRYEQRYRYDRAGNLEQMRHSSGGVDFWTRRYDYAAASNRLLSTSRPGDGPAAPYSATYDYDAFGNMTRIPGILDLRFNEHEHLEEVDLGGGGTAYYAYDTNGRRVRKVIERLDGSTDERLYVDDVEIFRTRTAAGALQFRRDTLHVMDRERRIALVETLLAEGGVAVAVPLPVTRYQLDNHLGSSLLELDSAGRVLSYEEYYPFGETAYHSAQGIAETSLKRYRHQGKERDAETGLYYYGARYYIPWLGRWSSPDPAGTDADLNLYAYVRNNPIFFNDPTGMWPSWRTVAIVAAVVVVGTVVTVATAGLAGPVIAGAVASVGLSGAAATVATGVVVGAVAGAAGGAASELTRQVASGEQVSGRAIARAAGQGALFGAVTGGVASGAAAFAGSARGVATAAAVTRTAQRVVPAAVRTGAATVARGAATVARTVARAPGVRHAGQALRAVHTGAENVGIAVARRGFSAATGLARGSVRATIAAERGAAVVERFAQTRSIAQSLESMRVFRGTRFGAEIQTLRETGYVTSDAARGAYLQAAGEGQATSRALWEGRVASEAAHQQQLRAWGSLEDYVRAHGEFGTELREIGQRSLISFTESEAVARSTFAQGGAVIETNVLKAVAVPQLIEGATEAEFLIPHMIRGRILP